MTVLARALGWSHADLMALEHRDRCWWASRVSAGWDAQRPQGGPR